MKYLLLVTMLLSGIYAKDLSQEAVLEVQNYIKKIGYKCDTVDGKPFFSDAYTVQFSCNNRYRYELKDVGGRWIVRVK